MLIKIGKHKYVLDEANLIGTDYKAKINSLLVKNKIFDLKQIWRVLLPLQSVSHLCVPGIFMTRSHLRLKLTSITLFI